MFKRVKVVFLILFCVLALAGPGFAASASDDVTIAFYTPFSLTKEQDISVSITPEDGKSSYHDFASFSEAKLLAEGEPGIDVSITYDNQITLTDSDSHTATLYLVCRADTSGYVADIDNGLACNSVDLQTDATSGNLYISLFPTSVNFGDDNVPGTYTGTLTVTIDYRE